MSEGTSCTASAAVRPGAMTTAMRAVRRGQPGELGKNALRVAIARAGRIEREWVIECGDVTVGRSDDADVCIADHASGELTLLRVDQGVMTLAIPQGASGRLQLEAGPCDLASLAGSAIALDASARGRIILAGTGAEAVALLFQRVPASEKRARPQLPASVRGGLLDRVDWLFTALAAASFVLHLGFVVGLCGADWPMAPSIAMLDDRFASIVFADVPEPPMPTLTEPSDSADPSTPSTPAPTERNPSTPSPSDPRRPHHETTTSAPPSESDPRIEVTASIDNAIDLLLGANGPNGTLANLVRDGGPTQGTAAALATATTIIPSSDPIATRTGHGLVTDFGPRSIGGHIGLRTEGEPVVEGPLHRPSILLAPTEDAPDHDIFDDAMLRRALRARMPAIQQCYETQLTHTPGLAGRISLSMQVERIGSLSHVEATDDTVGSRGLSECVINNVRTIRLPTGPTETVTVTYPIVFAPQS